MRFELFITKFHFRSQITSFNHTHKKDIDAIKNCLKDFKCGHCQNSTDEEKSSVKIADEKSIIFKPIGFIKTIFNEKRAVPRQASVADSILSKIEISKESFTSNPELSLESLDEFSHIWIIYNFHKNDSHSKPKVYPPRLEGKNVGVFATRSPHRPNSLGMSLVKLDRIEGTTVYFYGTDMLDSTPVLDIKPYIPDYDYPKKRSAITSTPNTPIKSREEPEGEEDHIDDDANAISLQNTSLDDDDDIKVPTWITDKGTLEVIFSENSLHQIREININQKSIEEILMQDPRSVYVREKYLSQIYSFQIDGKNVICRFDDKNRTVTVLQIRNIMDMSDE